MNQSDDGQAMKIKTRGSLSECPVCGYKDGFHVSFSGSEKSLKCKVILICPSCHKRFDIGWDIHLESLSQESM